MGEIIFFFLEGDGDKYFFEKYISFLHEKGNTIKEIKIIGLKGIGDYQYKAARIFKYEAKNKKYKDLNKKVLLHYDTDVFEENSNITHVDWVKVEAQLKEQDSEVVIHHIAVKRNLEDLLLVDKENLLKHLELSIEDEEIQSVLDSSRNSDEKIEELYKLGSNLYTKNQDDLKVLLSNYNYNKLENEELNCMEELKELIIEKNIEQEEVIEC